MSPFPGYGYLCQGGCGKPARTPNATCQECRARDHAAATVCPGCGETKSYRATRCANCNRALHVRAIPTCATCGTPITYGATECIPCRAKRYESDDRPFPLAPTEASRYGAIITLENTDGKILVIHRTGKPGDVVKNAYLEATSIDPTFRIVTVSTPTSIYTDLQGNRPSAGSGGWNDLPYLPERTYGEMVHPRLMRNA